MSSSIEHDYAPVCDLYDRHLGPALFEPYAVDLAGRVANDRAEGSVLEMACGTGILTQQLRTQLKPAVSLTATDINPGMLDYAQMKLKASKESTGVRAILRTCRFPMHHLTRLCVSSDSCLCRIKTARFAKCTACWSKEGSSHSAYGAA
jgi:hypothetical protein